MQINVKIYNSKDKLIGYRQASRPGWRKVYGKLGMAGAYKWFLRVVYGRGRNAYGQMATFANEGNYTNLYDAKRAFKIFIEKD